MHVCVIHDRAEQAMKQPASKQLRKMRRYHFECRARMERKLSMKNEDKMQTEFSKMEEMLD